MLSLLPVSAYRKRSAKTSQKENNSLQIETTSKRIVLHSAVRAVSQPHNSSPGQSQRPSVVFSDGQQDLPSRDVGFDAAITA